MAVNWSDIVNYPKRRGWIVPFNWDDLTEWEMIFRRYGAELETAENYADLYEHIMFFTDHSNWGEKANEAALPLLDREGVQEILLKRGVLSWFD